MIISKGFMYRWGQRIKEAAVLSDGKNTHLTDNAEGREAQNA